MLSPSRFVSNPEPPPTTECPEAAAGHALRVSQSEGHGEPLRGESRQPWLDARSRRERGRHWGDGANWKCQEVAGASFFFRTKAMRWWVWCNQWGTRFERWLGGGY